MHKPILQGFLVLLVACCCAHANTGSNESTISVKDGLFIHITSGPDDPHRVLMALQMAAIMSEDSDVLVYFDIKGIEVVLKDAGDVSFSHFPSSKTQIQDLLSKKVPIMACPGCLKAAGKSPADLMEGVEVANKETFYSFTKGRILSIDY